ncbi:MAG: hypothetical protein WD226_04900 [Planctomycetota bacterium]
MRPPPIPPSPQELQDAEHLNYLAVGHYIVGALTGLVGCLPLIHVTIGGMMVSGRMGGDSSGTLLEESLFGWFFIAIGGMIVLFTWAVAVAMLLAGRWLSARRNHTFCFVVACVECAFMPLGTILGVLSLLALLRPSVKALFQSSAEAGASAPS